MAAAEEDVEACVARTQELLGQLITLPKNSEKHLKRPPVSFLHHVMTEVTRQTGFAKRLFPADMALADRNTKLDFLKRAFAIVAYALDEDRVASPEKAVSGLEVAKTNLWMQKLHQAATTCSKEKSDEAVQHVLGKHKRRGSGASVESAGHIECPDQDWIAEARRFAADSPAEATGEEASRSPRSPCAPSLPRSPSKARLEDARRFAAEAVSPPAGRLKVSSSADGSQARGQCGDPSHAKLLQKLKRSEAERKRLDGYVAVLERELEELRRSKAEEAVAEGDGLDLTLGKSLSSRKEPEVFQDIEVVVRRDESGATGYSVEPNGLPRICRLDPNRKDLHPMQNGDIIQFVNDSPVHCLEDYKRVAYGVRQLKLSLIHQVARPPNLSSSLVSTAPGSDTVDHSVRMDPQSLFLLRPTRLP